jgi:hypothetical protein
MIRTKAQHKVRQDSRKGHTAATVGRERERREEARQASTIESASHSTITLLSGVKESVSALWHSKKDPVRKSRIPKRGIKCGTNEVPGHSHKQAGIHF